jgi:hypothetical protein
MKKESSNQNEDISNDQTLDQAIQASSEPVITKTVTAEECRVDIEQTASNDSESEVESDTKQVRSTQEILDMIRDRPKSNDSSSDSSSKAAEPTDFEKSLFVDGVVDWKNYKGIDELFDLFNAEAVNGVDVRYASYQDGLLHLLQHCYGYFYSLKHDSERYQEDIKSINHSISSVNLSSNKANPLEVKIIKLVWKGTQISRSRISAYANILKNAWCKGPIEKNVTDNDGRVLPSVLAKQVKLYGGLESYSRQSQAQLNDAEHLRKSGYTNSKDRKIDIVRDAMTKGEFVYNDEKLQMAELGRLTCDGFAPDSFRDGERFLVLGTWDAKKCEININATFEEDKPDGVVNKAELQFYERMKKLALKRTGH